MLSCSQISDFKFSDHQLVPAIGLLLKPLNANVAELHWIIMSGETEIAGFAVLAGMLMIGHVISDLAEVSVQNHRAVQLHFDGRSFHRHFLEIPFADRAL